jgi:hypothetical protein
MFDRLNVFINGQWFINNVTFSCHHIACIMLGIYKNICSFYNCISIYLIFEKIYMLKVFCNFQKKKKSTHETIHKSVKSYETLMSCLWLIDRVLRTYETPRLSY